MNVANETILTPQCAALAARHAPKRRPNRLGFVLGLTATYMVVEAIGGWASGSLALLADAGHMLTDVGALGLALFTAWMAQKPADAQRTYGWLRGEILAALANGVALLAIAALICVEAWRRFHDPQPIELGLFAGIATVGLIVNLISLKMLHGDHAHSLNSRAAYLHVFADMLGSVGALLAALIIKFTGWNAADPILSVLLSLLIVAGAWRLVRESVDVLLEAAPAHVKLDDVRAAMLEVAGVSDVHDLHIWTVTSGVVALSAHATVPELQDHPAALASLGHAVGRMGIAHATIQLETRGACDAEALAAGMANEGGHGHDHGHGHSHAGHSHPH